MEYARAYFAGYDLYLGFPKRNTNAVSFLQKRSYRLIEESYHDIFVFDGSVIQPETAGIVKVTECNFSAFRKIHQVDSDMYWNSDRIYSSLNEWIIYLLYQNDIAVGYVCARDGEIFSLGYQDN